MLGSAPEFPDLFIHTRAYCEAAEVSRLGAGHGVSGDLLQGRYASARASAQNRQPAADYGGLAASSSSTRRPRANIRPFCLTTPVP